LSLGKCAQTSQPDLLGRFLDGSGELVVGNCAGECFEFLGHDVLLDEWRLGVASG
jgi:hypothetical protein